MGPCWCCTFTSNLNSFLASFQQYLISYKKSQFSRNKILFIHFSGTIKEKLINLNEISWNFFQVIACSFLIFRYRVWHITMFSLTWLTARQLTVIKTHPNIYFWRQVKILNTSSLLYSIIIFSFYDSSNNFCKSQHLKKKTT